MKNFELPEVNKIKLTLIKFIKYLKKVVSKFISKLSPILLPIIKTLIKKIEIYSKKIFIISKKQVKKTLLDIKNFDIRKVTFDNIKRRAWVLIPPFLAIVAIVFIRASRGSYTKVNAGIKATTGDTEAMFVNVNPTFKVEFGNKENPGEQRVRFEVTPSENNPFEKETTSEIKQNLIQKTADTILGPMPLAIEMKLTKASIYDPKVNIENTQTNETINRGSSTQEPPTTEQAPEDISSLSETQQGILNDMQEQLDEIAKQNADIQTNLDALKQSVPDIVSESRSVYANTELIDLGRSFSNFNKDNRDPDNNELTKKTIINREVVPGVDVEYQIIEGRGLKEEIVVKQLDTYDPTCIGKLGVDTTDLATICSLPMNSFTFTISLDPDVRLNQSIGSTNKMPSGTYFFTDKHGRYLFHFLTPFAEDALGNITNSVKMDVKPVENTESSLVTYEIILTVDLDWVLDPSRQFPLRVDPSIVHDTEVEFDTGSTLNRVITSGPNVLLYEQEINSDDYTVGLWHMNETVENSCSNGEDACDTSGNSNHGTATGTSILSGMIGNARNFSTTSDYLTVTSSPLVNMTDTYTLEAWIKPSSTAVNQSVINKWTTGVGGYRMSLTTLTPRCTAANTANAYRDASNTVPTSVWTHLACVYNAKAGLIDVYINGELKNGTLTGTAPASMTSNGGNLFISGSTNPFTGIIDEVRISNIARTPGEIKVDARKRSYGIYVSGVLDLTINSSSPEATLDDLQWTESGVTTGDGETTYFSTSLVAQWNFNETSGTAATDSITGTAPPVILGGTISDVGGYRIHKFLTSGTFIVPAEAEGDVEILVVGGGGGGGSNRGGGGGAGGLVYDASFAVTAQSYTVTVGAGGNNASQATNTQGDDGDSTVFDSITATGGGGGGGGSTTAGRNGGSGGGGGANGAAGGAGGVGSQGYNGGTPTSNWRSGAGGGGAGAVGANSTTSGGAGGNGLSTYSALLIAANAGVDISGTYWIAGGGGGGTDVGTTYGAGGNGGGGAGTKGTANGVAGTANSGGGGGGCGDTNKGGNGGSGIVIIRYPYAPTSNSGTLMGFASLGSQDASPGTGWTSDNRRWGAGALMFDGVDDYVNINFSDSHKFSTNDTFSIEAWFRTKGEDDGTVADYLIGRRESGKYTYALYLGTDSKVNFAIYDGTNTPTVSSITSVGDSKWHHVAGVRDVSTDKLYLYVDGIIQQETTDTTTTTIDTSNPGTIGCAYESGACIANTFFKGVIDSTRIYSRALTASEILSNYNAGNIELQTRTSTDGTTWEAWKPTTGETQILSGDTSVSGWVWDNLATYMPKSFTNDTTTFIEGIGSFKLAFGAPLVNANTLALWHLDETNGDNVGDDIFDSTTNNNDGEIYGTNLATGVVDGIVGKARNFNGTDDYIEANSALATDYPFTLSAWFKTSNTAAGDRVIFSLVDKDVANVKYGIGIDDTHHAMIQASNTGVNEVLSTELVNDGKWHHLAGVFNSSTDKRLYLDGIYKGSITTSVTSSTAVDRWSIGRYGDSSPDSYFPGAIDEIKISNVSRTSEEIAETFRAGRDHRATYTLSSTIPSSEIKLPFWVASDRQGTFMEALIGESSFANYTSGSNVVAFWNMESAVDDSIESLITGGTVTDVDGYRIHKFLTSGTFVVPAGAERDVEVLVVAGGGQGGTGGGGGAGGGGAGGYKYSKAFTITAQSYPVTVGTGGSGITSYSNPGDNGDNSVFSTLTAIGGGGGGPHQTLNAGSGGSGGGGGYNTNAGAGTAGQGYIGGETGSNSYSGGGGGGAGAVGNAPSSTATSGMGGTGGAGINTYSNLLIAANAGVDISGVRWIAGGGGGATYSVGVAAGGNGGGGAGGRRLTVPTAPVAGTTNTGGGGGGSCRTDEGAGASGGSGIVIIRYPYNKIKDSSLNGNDGYLIGDIGQGKIGKGAVLNGTSDYIIIPSSPNFDLQTLTIEAWVYNTDFTTDAGFIFEKTTNGTVNTQYSCFFNSDNNFYFRTYNTVPTADDLTFTTGSYFINNVWNHVACTYDGTSKKVYVNGVLAASKAYSETLQTNAAGTSIIGAYGSGESYFYNGIIDEVRISSVARTADEIRQAYEYGSRTHPITIDFKAALNSGGIGALISSGTDLAFTIDSTSYGATQLGSNLYEGDKVIVEENVNGTEYIAQGDVSAIAVATGETTVSEWDAASSFPSGGFTSNATVFKWQREFFDITGSLSTHRNAINNITLRISDASQGANVWLDDFKSVSSYLTDPTATDNITSTPNRYLQYRAIFSTVDTSVTPIFSSATTNYTPAPLTEDLMRHGKWFWKGIKQPFWWTTTKTFVE